MSRVVTWESGSPSLPRAVIAIGVFDGVHLGHQALLAATAADARQRSASSVAVTFDRDPDQVVTPESAAPQLLSLDDKLAFMGECGVNTVLVVPFTEAVARLSATAFLDGVVAPAVDVVAIHVGADFRFGAEAAGDLATLSVWAEARGIAVRGHELLTVDCEPVTSTRIRGLVASGDVAAAAQLLGRAHRVTGTVVRGCEQGRELGFPTANLRPAPHAALPADGVYAGGVHLTDGSTWPAAISVGTPPTFPEARDYLEVHLIDFEGDLYDAVVIIEFAEKLRDQRAFDDLTDLTAAIRADVARARDVAATSGQGLDLSFRDLGPATGAGVAPAQLPDIPPDGSALPDDAPQWVPVASVILVGQYAAMTQGGVSAATLAMALDAANVAYRWDPFDPRDAVPAMWRSPMTFSVWVPAELASVAADVVAGTTPGEPPEDLEEWLGDDVSDDDLVEDPAALAAAQAAVNEARNAAPFSVIGAGEAIPEGAEEFAWVYLAEGHAPGPIEYLSEALNDAEIETLWEPFPPEKRAAFWGRTNLTVYVPLVELDAARALADGIGAWDGVVYEGPDAGSEDPDTGSVDTDAGSGDRPTGELEGEAEAAAD